LAEPVLLHFLGGLGEIGRNALLVRQGEDAVVIDLGVMFPKADMPGVDVVLPDYRVLTDPQLRLHGVLLTHGHEDHIGALPYLVKERPTRLIGSRVTLAFARSRLEQSRVQIPPLEEVPDYGSVEVGPFRAEFIPVTHSIPGATAIALTTRQGVILHTGDFKIDPSPVDGRRFGLRRVARLGEEGVRLLLSDSTNADEAGATDSERAVAGALREIFLTNSDQRLTVACFSSHLHRISQIAEVCRVTGRRIALAGRSLQRNVRLAEELGLLSQGLLGDLVDVEEVDGLSPEAVCVIATGSQGESTAALHRLAFDRDSWFSIGARDTIVFSSDTIPGNESAVNRLVNQLCRRQARVIYPSVQRVHASGHARQSELVTLAALARPEYFVPVHGEYRQLAAHHRLVTEAQLVRREACTFADGDLVELGDDGLRLLENRAGEYLYMDGIVGEVTRGVLRDRRSLSEDGIVVVALTLGEDGGVVGEPEVFSFGWVHDELEEGLLIAVRKVARATAEDHDGRQDLREVLRRQVARFVRERTKRRPLVVPLVIEV